MSDPLFDEDDDANTPLTAEEREGLIPTYIALRAELNEAEQIGIADADSRVPAAAAQADVRGRLAIGRAVPDDGAQHRHRRLSDTCRIAVTLLRYPLPDYERNLRIRRDRDPV